MTSKGQVTISKVVGDHLGLGSRVSFERMPVSRVELVPETGGRVASHLAALQGLARQGMNTAEIMALT